jgi:hypothetical protein
VESLRGEFTLTAALLLLFDFGFEKRVGAGAEISKHFDIFKAFYRIVPFWSLVELDARWPIPRGMIGR